jgi:DNA-directed RNA polymerase specialized sigma subunit
MRDVEKYLMEHSARTKEYRKQMLDFKLAQHAYEESYHNMPSSCNYKIVTERNRKIAKPVEIKAMIVIDRHRAAVESIERRMKETKVQIDAIEELVNIANLTSREREYIRLRYFCGLTAQAVAQRMFVSDATGGRTRYSALEKIEKVVKKTPQ